MENRWQIFLLLVTVMLLAREEGANAMGGLNEEDEQLGAGQEWFLLRNLKQVVKTDAGEMKVVKSIIRGKIVDRPMHIGFITMEPKSLFVPQYLDSSLIMFIRTGEAKVGFIFKDELAERHLKMGDIYGIPAGSAFYLMNTGEGQRLHVICSIDPSESIGLGAFQSFFIGGGSYPTSVFSGFDLETLATAFNVTMEEVKEITTRQDDGPIVFLDGSRSPRSSMWARFLQLEEQERLQQLKKMSVLIQEQVDEEQQDTWSWRKLLISALEKKNKGGRSPDSYNIYERRADFRNKYGWSIALDESEYDPLKRSGIGVYLVNLTAGSMMAPHVNPAATEYGIVLRGSGTVQIVFPNGTQALNERVAEGDVFLVPRYFPFCQIASSSGPFEFFGFTTSSRKNRPQFLVGGSSVLHAISVSELAAGFGVGEDRIRHLVDSQKESIILPSPSSAASPKKLQKSEVVVGMVNNLGADAFMGLF